MREPKHSTNSIMHMSALQLRPVDGYLVKLSTRRGKTE